MPYLTNAQRFNHSFVITVKGQMINAISNTHSSLIAMPVHLSSITV